jgi:hypothetical protein
MHAIAGDAIVVDSLTVGSPPRRGEILEVVHDDAGEHYRVRWDDGHESTFFPGSDAYVVHVHHPTPRA